jgi:hypothetical protein
MKATQAVGTWWQGSGSTSCKRGGLEERAGVQRWGHDGGFPGRRRVSKAGQGQTRVHFLSPSVHSQTRASGGHL